MIINLNGEINDDTVKDIADNILAKYTKGEDITIFIDSLGGYVDSAFEIINMLDELKSAGSSLIAKNTGDVMSCATLIWLSCNKRVYDESNGKFLIHNPWSEVTGDADLLIQAAADLTKIENTIAEQYANISGKNKNEMLERMQLETPLTTDELMSYHFITHRVVNKRKYDKQN